MHGFKTFAGRINLWAVSVLVLVLCTEALAADGKSNWRAVYDVVMLWVNFFILVFLFLKYGKTPLKKFIMGQREALAEEITGLENQRDEMVHRVQQTVKEMDQSQARFKEIKEKIIAQGKARKQAIIDEAGSQSRAMLEDARRRVENLIVTAKKNFRSDLVDEAVAMAMKNISSHITEEDNQRFLNQFLDTAVNRSA